MPISCKPDLPAGAVAVWVTALACLVTGLALLLGAAKRNEAQFMSACTKQGGSLSTTAREYVCLKGK